ncbi:MAG: hypothetical protein AAGA60_31700, partial [Cyanobacteria bacterium P01_E01_bin.42]
MLKKLHWNEELNWYEGYLEICDRNISIYIAVDASDRAIDTSHIDERLNNLLSNAKRFRQSVAEEFLDNYNQNW